MLSKDEVKNNDIKPDNLTDQFSVKKNLPLDEALLAPADANRLHAWQVVQRGFDLRSGTFTVRDANETQMSIGVLTDNELGISFITKDGDNTPKLSVASTLLDEVQAATQSIGTSFTDVTNTSTTFTTRGGDCIFWLDLTYYRKTAGNISYFKLVIDNLDYPSATGMAQYTNELLSHKMFSRCVAVPNLDAGSHTIKLQAKALTSGTTEFDTSDYFRLTMVEHTA